MTVPPLHGEKTHPLTQHARMVLAALAKDGPRPSLEINHGVVNRFHREGLTETVMLPSPYLSHRGGTCPHERVTDAGRAALTQEPSS